MRRGRVTSSPPSSRSVVRVTRPRLRRGQCFTWNIAVVGVFRPPYIYGGKQSTPRGEHQAVSWSARSRMQGRCARHCGVTDYFPRATLKIGLQRDKNRPDQVFSRRRIRCRDRAMGSRQRCFTCNIGQWCFTCNIRHPPVAAARPWRPSDALVVDGCLRERGIHPTNVVPGRLQCKDEG